MDGFEGNDKSRPKWTTDFQDNQITKENDGKPWIDHGYAGWGADIDVSYMDSGDKVIVSQYHSSQISRILVFRKSHATINKGFLQK